LDLSRPIQQCSLIRVSSVSVCAPAPLTLPPSANYQGIGPVVHPLFLIQFGLYLITNLPNESACTLSECRINSLVDSRLLKMLFQLRTVPKEMGWRTWRRRLYPIVNVLSQPH